MELYTKKLIIEGFEKNCTLSEKSLIMIIGKITPIELPSDEEVEIKGDEFSNRASYSECFKEGAIWVIEQIKQQETKKKTDERNNL